MENKLRITKTDLRKQGHKILKAHGKGYMLDNYYAINNSVFNAQAIIYAYQAENKTLEKGQWN